MDIHPCVIQSRSELGSKSYIFMENDKIILSEFYLNDKPLTQFLEGYLSKKTVGWATQTAQFLDGCLINETDFEASYISRSK